MTSPTNEPTVLRKDRPDGRSPSIPWGCDRPLLPGGFLSVPHVNGSTAETRSVVALILLLLLPLILLSSGSSFAEDKVNELDLAQCLERAIENSRQLRASTEIHAAARADADRAHAQRWPSLVFDANGTYVSEVNEIDFPALPPRTVRFGDNDSYDLAARVQVPLYTGGALSATERAQRAVARASAFDVSADSLRLVRNVRSGFVQALGADAEASAAQLAVNRLRRHLGELAARIEVGTASEDARLEAESRLRIAQQRHIGAQERLRVARLGLGSLLGVPGEHVWPTGSLDDPMWEDLGVEIESGEQSLAQTAETSFVEARPELQALDQRVRASRYSQRAARGAFLPSVSAVAQLHYGDPGVRVTQDEWMDWASAGVQLRWILWDAGARAAELRSRSATTRARTEARSALREQFENLLAVARERVVSQHRQLELANERDAIERRRVELAEGRYQQGLSTESAFLDVQDDLAEAEIDLAVARSRLRIAQADLLYASGR